MEAAKGEMEKRENELRLQKDKEGKIRHAESVWRKRQDNSTQRIRQIEDQAQHYE